eukprot:15443024-Alexandrium_andersonii.AAC.1
MHRPPSSKPRGCCGDPRGERSGHARRGRTERAMAGLRAQGPEARSSKFDARSAMRSWLGMLSKRPWSHCPRVVEGNAAK